MTRYPLFILVAFLALGALLPTKGQNEPSLPPASTIVKAETHGEPAAVPPGGTGEILVNATILRGFHLQANHPSKDYLVPTTLSADLPASLKLLDTVYPPGKLIKLGFSNEKLLVYDGAITIKLKVQVGPQAAPGKLSISLTLRYQACNETTCLPPAKISIPASIQISAK